MNKIKFVLIVSCLLININILQAQTDSIKIQFCMSVKVSASSQGVNGFMLFNVGPRVEFPYGIGVGALIGVDMFLGPSYSFEFITSWQVGVIQLNAIYHQMIWANKYIHNNAGDCAFVFTGGLIIPTDIASRDSKDLNYFWNLANGNGVFFGGGVWFPIFFDGNTTAPNGWVADFQAIVEDFNVQK